MGVRNRIATWISQYCSEHGTGALDRADVEAYNNLIENFIVESNPESIQRTQKNISLVGQREQGERLREDYDAIDIRSKADVERFAVSASKLSAT